MLLIYYITLKKAVQKDMNGTLKIPAPPLLFLLQQAQEQTLRLQDENSELRSTLNNLKTKLDAIIHENEGLVESLEEKNGSVADLKSTITILNKRVDEFEAEAVRNQAEKTEVEVKLKEFKKKHVSELKEQQIQVNDLENAIKAKSKETMILAEYLRVLVQRLEIIKQKDLN